MKDSGNEVLKRKTHKNVKSDNLSAPLFGETFMLFAIIALWNINAFLCYDNAHMIRKILFSAISIIEFYILRSCFKGTKKVYGVIICSCVYLALLITSVIVLISKQTSTYILFKGTVYNIPEIIMMSSVPICVLIGTIKRSKIVNKIPFYFILVFPVIIISALNSVPAVITTLFLIMIYLLTSIVKDKAKLETLVVFYTVFSALFLVIIVATIIICDLKTNGFNSYFEQGIENSLPGIFNPFIFSVTRCGLIFPLVTVILGQLLFAYLILISLVLKSDYNFSLAFSASFLLFNNTGWSVLIECITGNNNGFENPMFSLYNTQLIVAVIILSFALTAIGRDPGAKQFPSVLKLIQMSFTKDVTKKRNTVFISYRRDGGSDFAMHVYDRLRLRKINPFYDIETMKNGLFNKKIYKKIEECDAFVLLLTKGALDRCINEGDWVRNEISYALKKKKKIIPLIASDFEYPFFLPEDVDSIRYYNAIPATNESFDWVIDELVKRLKQKDD